MKLFIYYIFIFLPLWTFGQQPIIPEMDFLKSESKTTRELNKLLNITDSNQIVVAISYGGGLSNIHYSLFLVYSPITEVKVFNSNQSIFDSAKLNLIERNISGNKSDELKTLLRNYYSKNKLSFDTDSLNVRNKPSENEMMVSGPVLDGTNYHILIWQLKGYSYFNSYAPHAYISMNYPGATERQNMLDFIHSFERLIKN